MLLNVLVFFVEVCVTQCFSVFVGVRVAQRFSVFVEVRVAQRFSVYKTYIISNSNMTSFFRFVNKLAIY